MMLLDAPDCLVSRIIAIRRDARDYPKYLHVAVRGMACKIKTPLIYNIGEIL